MDITKKFGSIEVLLQDMPDTVAPSLYYEIKYTWLDSSTDDYVSGVIGTHGKHIIDFDGCTKLPEAIEELLTKHGYHK